MKRFALIATAALGASALGLAFLGRRAVYGELAGSMGDSDAQSAADSLSWRAAFVSGLRTIVGKSPTGNVTLMN